MQFKNGELTNFANGTTTQVKSGEIINLGGNVVIQLNPKGETIESVTLSNPEILFNSRGLTVGGWERAKTNHCTAKYLILEIKT